MKDPYALDPTRDPSAGVRAKKWYLTGSVEGIEGPPCMKKSHKDAVQLPQ